MNELQLALAGAAVVGVIGVWGYNAWQERKYRKMAKQLFRGEQKDVLVGAGETAPKAATAPAAPAAVERVEPVIGVPEPLTDLPVDEALLHTAETESSVPQAADLGARPSVAEPAADETLSSAWVDEVCDCAVTLRASTPLSAAGVWAVQSAWAGAISKPVHWLARNGGAWAVVDTASNERYAEWLVALQLVDRRGAVSDADLTRFFDGVGEFARQLGCDLALPGRAETLSRAQQLDAFCAQLDVQFNLSIIHAQGGTFAGTKLRGMCQAAGLELSGDGRYHARNAAGETEYTLGNLGAEGFDPQSMSSLATHGVSLSFDVPRVADGPAAFNRMVLVARQLSQGLGGVLVDAQRAPLSDAMIGLIRGKIDELQQQMAKAGMPAGSLRARRLFS